jgi:ABC-type branched-subunit amino acid transport system substrate-binding protein
MAPLGRKKQKQSGVAGQRAPVRAAMAFGCLAAWALVACASTGARGQLQAAGIPAAELPRRNTAVAAAVDVEGRPGPRRVDATVPEGGVLGAADRGAEADFEAARAEFERGESVGARVGLEAFVKLHPEHPSRLPAELMLARLALGRGEPKEARRILTPWVTGVRSLGVGGGPGQGTGTGGGGGGPAAEANAAGTTAGARLAAQYYLGLSEVRIGDMARARELLMPFLPAGGVAAEIAASDDSAIELSGALAEALALTEPAAALDLWNGYLRAGRESEKAWARQRATETAARMTPEWAWRAYGAAPPSGLQRAVLGNQAALYLRARGDTAGASYLQAETNAARHNLGFDRASSRVGPGDPNRVGLAIPLSGKFEVVGEATLRAAMLAGGVPANPTVVGGAGPSHLVIRDTGMDAERGARSVSELTRAEAVIGIVGAIGTKLGTPAISQAAEDGIALLALDDAAPGALTSTFQMIHAADVRAATLARQALKLGVRRFAVLAPDSAAGRKLREAFRKAVNDGGGSLVVESMYVAGATSFASAIAPIKKVFFEAIFVPDSAERIALIAPALAVADLWPQAFVKPAPTVGRRAAAAGRASARPDDRPGANEKARPVLLLSTASDLSPKLVEQAGRYVQGALLCPGFFAADDDPVARPFVDAYRLAYGRDPHAVEAYAYDAVATFRLMAQQGIKTRADLIQALGSRDGKALLTGLTGNLAFGPDHGRLDAPIIYVVDGDAIRALR